MKPLLFTIDLPPGRLRPGHATVAPRGPCRPKALHVPQLPMRLLSGHPCRSVVGRWGCWCVASLRPC